MYKSMAHALDDLERHGHLVRIKEEIDPNLEAAEIHRKIYDANGPAILFERIKGSPFRAVSNIFGTKERTDFLFRKTIDAVKKVTELKADPANFLKNPLRYVKAPFTALSALPSKAIFSKPINYGKTTVDKLPQIKSWPMDGGPFVTLPQVLTLPPGTKNIMQSNIGMYRIQLGGNDYAAGEIGMHYQIHRGIGVHHTAYNESDEDFKASIFIGGPPSHSFAAIMPMPEGLSELTFAGMLNGRRFRYFWQDGHLLSADADFCIVGTIRKGEKKPEGPFGDHLGYYSLQHDFPVMDVDAVYHRKDAIWHFTVVGRPPQEDSSFGYLIHQLVSELTPVEFPGLKSIHAVDAAGVHPLLLAVGQERYMPFRERRPEEIITIANRILGSGQTSLAKFLWIAAYDPKAPIDAHHTEDFFDHVLRRVRWERDLHFQTKTTIDTLDYSGDGWNAGSKVIIAACGDPVRDLAREPLVPDADIPDVDDITLALPGVLALSVRKFENYQQAGQQVERIVSALRQMSLESYPLIVLSDDARFLAEHINNFLWTTFTRANPSHDIYGVDPFVEYKHWGCRGSLIIDARSKPHHAPELITDPDVSARVDQLFAKGGALHGIV